MGKVTAIRKQAARPEHTGPRRPVPPADLLRAAGGQEVGFMPAHDIGPWVEHHLLTEGSPLFNQDHVHLREAVAEGDLCFLWAATGHEKQGRTVLGTAEKVSFQVGGWRKQRQQVQMAQWFGCVPPFLITLAADYCATCEDAEFAALVEHELFHIAHACDPETGALKFDRQTGRPVLGIRGHDVEEFIGVVRRYGVPATGALRELVETAKHAPEVAHASLAHACGLCLERAA